jgi:hypothetical protein
MIRTRVSPSYSKLKYDREPRVMWKALCKILTPATIVSMVSGIDLSQRHNLVLDTWP